jgi:hypothetical protein
LVGNVDEVTPPIDKKEAAATTCSSCGVGLASGQDWCLSCGTAAPGRLNRRPGGRAALITVALTLALTTGAVAASYAALSNAPIKKGAVKYPLVLAQQVQPPAPTETTTTAAKPPRKHKSSTPAAHTKHSTAPAATKTASSGSTSSPAKTETPKAAQPTLIKIPAGAGALYDPSGRALFSDGDPHDPAAVYDDDNESSWAVTSNGVGDLLLGYVIDLKKARPVQRLDLLTDTPGFRAEIFGANTDELPPQISDSRWAFLKGRDKVDETSKEGGKPGDGKERITISDGSQKYRYLLIWFTTPAPTVAPDPPSRTVRLFDLKLYG